MLAFALIPVLGAITAAATSPQHMRVFSRQLDQALPSQCNSQCGSTLKIYDACLKEDYNTCLTVCEQGTFNEFTACFDCVLENTAGVTSSDRSMLQNALDELSAQCNAGGKSVTGGLSLGGPAGGSTPYSDGGPVYGPTPSDDWPDYSSAFVTGTGVIASLTSARSSAAGGLTLPASVPTSRPTADAAATTAAGPGSASAPGASASAPPPGSGASSVMSLAKGFLAALGVAAGLTVAL